MKIKQSSKVVKVLENGTEQGAGLKCPTSLGSTVELGMTSHLRCYRKASFIGQALCILECFACDGACCCCMRYY